MTYILVYELFCDREASDWYGHAELLRTLPTGKPDWSKKPVNSLRDMQAPTREALRQVLDDGCAAWPEAKTAKRVELVSA